MVSLEQVLLFRSSITNHFSNYIVNEYYQSKSYLNYFLDLTKQTRDKWEQEALTETEIAKFLGIS